MVKLTRFEITRLISARSLQISLGAPALVKIDKPIYSPMDISKKEFDEKLIPLAVVRQMPNGEIQRVEVL